MAAKVAVIGAGLAGTAAAAWARKHCAEVVMVQAGTGATTFSSGALDVAGDLSAALGRPDLAGTDVAANLAALVAANPSHPYSRAAESPEALHPFIQEVTALLFPESGALAMEGSTASNTACFTSVGTIKFTALFPKATARPGAPGMEKPLVVGIERMLDFEADSFVKVAAENARLLGAKCEPTAAWAPAWTGLDMQAPEASSLLSYDPSLLVRAIKDALARAPAATSVVVPPMLPAGNRTEVLATIEKEVSLPVYEPLSLPPSVAGARLCAHLAGRARELGATSFKGEVIGFAGEGGLVKSLEVRTARGVSHLEADAFVLASGKFLGGGLEKSRAFREKVFDLPVFVGNKRAHEKFSGDLVGLRVNERHVLFEAGLLTDETLRPIGNSGAAAFRNLFAAGAVLAGYNYMAEASGAGVAVATGARAGANAAQA